MSTRSKLTALIVLSLAGLTACGAPAQVALPDVAGTQLDHAIESLRDAGFENVVSRDGLDDRMILMDSNWVVVGQEPAAVPNASVDTEVELLAMKKDDADVASRLPEGTPVRVELEEVAAAEEREVAEREAEEARRQEAEAAEAALRAEAEAAERATARQSYVEHLDPALRVANQMIGTIEEYAAVARVGGAESWEFQLGADSVIDLGAALVDGLAVGAPSSEFQLDVEYGRLQAAADTINRACQTLATAYGPTKQTSLERFDEIWDPALREWNESLKALYTGTSVSAPVYR